MFSATLNRTNENSSLNAGNSFSLLNPNPNTQGSSNNANTTPLKFIGQSTLNQNNSNIFAAPNTGKSSLFPNNPGSNLNTNFGNNAIGNANPTGGLFGNNNINSGFLGGNISNGNNNPNNNPSIFGIGNPNNGIQNKNLFGGNINTPTLGNSANPGSNIFGGPNANSNSSNIFSANNDKNNANNNSIFASKQEAANTNNSQLTFGANSNQGSINNDKLPFNFGGNNNNNNQNQTLFTNNSNNLNGSNLFCNNNTANSNNQPSNGIFGAASNLNNSNNIPNAANQNNLFMDKNATANTNNAGIFGNSLGTLNGNKANENAAGTTNNPNSQSQKNLFGNNSTSTNPNSLFGKTEGLSSNQNPINNSSSTGIFGNPVNNQGTNPNSNSNIFGTNTANNSNTNTNSNTLFGNKTQATSTNLFGNNTNNTSNPNPDANKPPTSIFGSFPSQTNNMATSQLGNPNSTNSNMNANKNQSSLGGLFNSSANSALNKASEGNNLLANNPSNTNNSNTNQGETKSFFGNTTNQTNPSNSANQGNQSSSPFSSNNTASVKPSTTSLFGNPTNNPITDASKPNNLNPSGSSLFSASNASNKTEPQRQESAQADNKALFSNPTANATNPNPSNVNFTSNSLFKANLTNERLTSPTKSNQKINSNSSIVSINNPEKSGESKAKFNQFTIYPNPLHKTLDEKFSINKPIPFENNLESRKNILGISRSEISERVIEAISKKMTIKEFFAKASEEALHEQSKFSSLKPKSKKSENHYEIFDEGYSRSKESYLETKYQMYLQREIFKQKQKNESKRKMNEEKNAHDYSENKGNYAFGSMGKTYEKDFYKNFRKQNYMSLLEKDFEMNKLDSPYNYSLPGVDYEKVNNFQTMNAERRRDIDMKNYELIKIMNENNFGNANNALEVQSKIAANISYDRVSDNKNLYLGKTDSKIPLAEKADEEIDLYDPLFWQSRVQHKKDTKEEEKKGFSKHLGSIKDGINKFFSIFSREDEEEEKALIDKIEPANKNKKIISIVAEIKNKNIFLSFHAHKDSPVSVLKGYIIEKLSERNEHKFHYLKNEHLLVLFKSSILVDENPLGHYEFEPSTDNLIQVVISSEKDSLKNSAEINTNMNDGQPNNTNNSADENRVQEPRNTQILHKIGEKSHLHFRSGRLRKKSKSPGKENLNRNSTNQMIIDNEEEDQNKEAEDNCFPVYNNEFDLYPSIQYIYRMKKNELKNVEGFKISNSFGKIKFRSKVDLTQLNLSEIVKIDRFEIELYPGKEMPKPGEGLNKPAVITIKQMFDQKGNIKELIQSVKEKEGRFIKYDEYKGKFKFEVERWVK